MRRAWAWSVVVLAALGACGGGAGVDVLAATRPPAAAPTAPSAAERTAASNRHDPDALKRSGAAGRELQCDGPVFDGYAAEEIVDYPGGSRPADVLAGFNSINGPSSVPKSGYTMVWNAGGRALFTYAIEGRAKVALIAVDRTGKAAADPSPGGPWRGEAWAQCDPAEFHPIADSDHRTELWSSATEARVPAAVIQSRAPSAHCWPGALILRLKTPKGSYVRDPGHTFADESLARRYESAVTLPADAVDTGFFRGDRHLWLAADRLAAYVVTPKGVELWPKSISSAGGCA